MPPKGDVPLYVRVRAVTENEHSHPLQTVVPETACVKWKLPLQNTNERDNLQCDPDSFDSETGSVFLEITNEEHKTRSKR